jgi:hypothetical protein
LLSKAQGFVDLIDLPGLVSLCAVSKQVKRSVSDAKPTILPRDHTRLKIHSLLFSSLTRVFPSLLRLDLSWCLRLVDIGPIVEPGTLQQLQTLSVAYCRNLKLEWACPFDLPSLDASATAITFDKCYSIMRSMPHPEKLHIRMHNTAALYVAARKGMMHMLSCDSAESMLEMYGGVDFDDFENGSKANILEELRNDPKPYATLRRQYTAIRQHIAEMATLPHHVAGDAGAGAAAAAAAAAEVEAADNDEIERLRHALSLPILKHDLDLEWMLLRHTLGTMTHAGLAEWLVNIAFPKAAGDVWDRRHSLLHSVLCSPDIDNRRATSCLRLYQRYHADLSYTMSHGESMLAMAAMNANVSAAKLLLQAQADPNATLR